MVNQFLYVTDLKNSKIILHILKLFLKLSELIWIIFCIINSDTGFFFLELKIILMVCLLTLVHLLFKARFSFLLSGLFSKYAGLFKLDFFNFWKTCTLWVRTNIKGKFPKPAVFETMFVLRNHVWYLVKYCIV